MKNIKKSVKVDDISITVEITRQTEDAKEFKKYMKKLDEYEKTKEKIKSLEINLKAYTQRLNLLECEMDAFFIE